jgi:hypothetical protein
MPLVVGKHTILFGRGASVRAGIVGEYGRMKRIEPVVNVEFVGRTIIGRLKRRLT